jgi:hypothetical protein
MIVRAVVLSFRKYDAGIREIEREERRRLPCLPQVRRPGAAGLWQCLAQHLRVGRWVVMGSRLLAYVPTSGRGRG